MNAAIYERTQILLGTDGLGKLQRSNILLVGTGGVGGHCAECLVRAGVGRMTLVDHDVVSVTNKNRQLIALDSTIGRSKVLELTRRLQDVHRGCVITAIDAFLLPQDMRDVLTRQVYDLVVDCIDSVACKIELIAAAHEFKIPIFSSCGAGGRLDPSQVSIGDLFETTNDGLARACRNGLRKRGIGEGVVTVVHSTEIGQPPLEAQRQESGGRDRAINGTISYMPPLFGLFLASAALRFLLGEKTPGKVPTAGSRKRDRPQNAAPRASSPRR